MWEGPTARHFVNALPESDRKETRHFPQNTEPSGSQVTFCRLDVGWKHRPLGVYRPRRHTPIVKSESKVKRWNSEKKNNTHTHFIGPRQWRPLKVRLGELRPAVVPGDQSRGRSLLSPRFTLMELVYTEVWHGSAGTAARRRPASLHSLHFHNSTRCKRGAGGGLHRPSLCRVAVSH